jgi:hypothetical protein
MSVHKIDGKLFNTDLAKGSWSSRKESDGTNMIDVNTESHHITQKLYLSSKDTYYLLSDVCGWTKTTEAYTLAPRLAAMWLLFNQKKLPVDLAEWAEKLEE